VRHVDQHVGVLKPRAHGVRSPALFDGAFMVQSPGATGRDDDNSPVPQPSSAGLRVVVQCQVILKIERQFQRGEGEVDPLAILQAHLQARRVTRHVAQRPCALIFPKIFVSVVFATVIKSSDRFAAHYIVNAFASVRPISLSVR